MNEEERKEAEERLEEIEERLAEIKEELEKLEDNYEAYDDALDEQGEILIGSISFMPSRILKELDEIAYDLGFTEFNDEAVSELEKEQEELETEKADIEKTL